MISPDSKLPDVGTTIFTVMSKMAIDFDAINLSQGFPDFEPPAALLTAMQSRLASGHHQYPPMAGIAPLREAIAEKVLRHYGVIADPETDITVTSGATEAIFVAVQAVVSKGDEVIIFDPAYDAYGPAVRLAGGRPIHIPLLAPHFEIDLDRLAAAMTQRTKLIIINSPHNPTGQVIGHDTLLGLEALCARAGCFVSVSYTHLTLPTKRIV